MAKVKVVTSKKVDFKKLAKSGGEMWTIMLDGTVEGQEHNYGLSKLVSFSNQVTDKTKAETVEENRRYFSFVTVMCDTGLVLNLPLNQGLYETYYSTYCDEAGNILDEHSMSGMSIAFKVTTFEDKEGKAVKDEKNRKYDKKDITQIEYSR